MFVLCELYHKDKKGKSQDSLDKEVWIKYKERTKKIPEGARDLFFKASNLALTDTSIQWVPWFLSFGVMWQNMRLTTHLHLVLRLRMSEAIPPLLYAFMVCIGKTLHLPKTH